MAAGLPADEARREAERRFGDVTSYREVLMTIDRRRNRRAARTAWWSELAGDLRYAWRGLLRTPAFSLGVVVTLTLGLGVTATLVGLVDRLLFKPPAHVVEPDRVVRYTLTQTFLPFGTFTNTSVTWNDVKTQRGANSLAGLAAFASGSASLGRGEAARNVAVMAVTPDYFTLLGVRAAVGRTFGPDDDPADGSARAAVISDRMWDRDFGRSPQALGAELQVGSARVVVVGVTPRYFNGIDLDATDLWLPFHAGARLLAGPSFEWENTWNWQWIKIVARLKPGVTRAVASAEATARYRAAVADDPERKADRGLVTYQPVIAGQGAGEGKEPMVAALLAAVSGLLLLISCANVANLMLARGMARSRELAVRLALGIGRGRLIRMLLAEALLLAGLAAGAGIGLAYGAGLLTRRWFLPNIEFVEPPVDGRLFLGMAFMAVATAVLVGVMPALRLSRPDLSNQLRSGGSGQASAGRDHQRVRRALLAVQGALSVILLVGAGLFVGSFRRVTAVDFGFRPERVVVADVDLSEAGYAMPARHAFFDEAYRRFATFPGVNSVSLGTANPFATRSATRVRMQNGDSFPRLKTGGPYFTAVTPEYFRTMGITLRQGRSFLAADGPTAPLVLVVNETLARTFWPGRDPLGQCLVVGRDATACREIVGVAADANSESLAREPVLAYYVPLAQSAGLSNDRTLFLRVDGRAEAAIPGIRRAVHGLAPGLPVPNVRTMAAQMDGLYRPWRLGAAVFGAMGLIALGVVLVGLYSVLSYGVAQRRREFGIRTALGASGAEITRLVVGEGVRVVGLGVLAGAVVALGLAPLVQRFLFRIGARDPATYAAVIGLLLAVAVAAALAPARRAGRADPMTALRTE